MNGHNDPHMKAETRKHTQTDTHTRVAMSQCRQRNGSTIRVLVVLNESEINEEEMHMELCFEPTLRERLLLELYTHGNEQFGVRDLHGPNCQALAAFLATKYDSGWKDGDPLSTRREDEEDDKEVAEFLRARREKREAQYDFVVDTDCVDNRSDLVDESMNTYEEYVQEELHKILQRADADAQPLVQHMRRVGLLRFARRYCAATEVQAQPEP
jgi:hypothetical protein